MSAESFLETLRELRAKATPGPWSQGMIGDGLIAELDYPARFGFIKIEGSDDGQEGLVDAKFILLLVNNASKIEALIEAVETFKVTMDGGSFAGFRNQAFEELKAALADLDKP